MSIKPIITLPDPLLRQASQPVAQVDDSLRKLAKDMLETMYSAPGIGLAAIQVAEPVRLAVVDVADKGEEAAPLVVINPVILWRSESFNSHDEGCLSIPEYYAEVERPKKIRLSYIDLSGKHNELEADGLLATCLQHEIDHINGLLFIDHLSKLKRDIVIRKFKKLSRDKSKDGKIL